MRGRTLLTHADEDFQDQGQALSCPWEPSPANLGPSLLMRHSMGATTTGGMDALLNPVTMEFPGAVSSSGQQFETQLAYGLAFFDDRFTLAPALGGPFPGRRTLQLALGTPTLFSARPG